MEVEENEVGSVTVNDIAFEQREMGPVPISCRRPRRRSSKRIDVGSMEFRYASGNLSGRLCVVSFREPWPTVVN